MSISDSYMLYFKYMYRTSEKGSKINKVPLNLLNTDYTLSSAPGKC